MATIDIGACISGGIAIFKRNPVFHIVGSILIYIVSQFSFGLLQGPMMVGYYRALNKEDAGGKAELGDLFKGFDDFVPALVAALVGAIVVTSGYFLCIIPGMLLVAILPTALCLVADGEKDGINALKRAWMAVKSNLVMAAVAMLVIGLLTMVGLIACCVGILITAPIGMASSHLLAKQIMAGEGAVAADGSTQA